MKKMHIVSGLISFTLFLTGSVWADNISDNFSANLTKSNMDHLTKDLGTLAGAGSFHDGKALGFPLGFDVGAHVSQTGVHSNDPILRDNGSTATSAFGQVEVGLPMKINVIARGGKIEDAKVIGGGVRVGLFTSDLPALPSVSLEALYDKTSHDYFDMQTYTGNAVLSFNVPFIEPYIGVGYDNSSLKPTGRAFAAAPGTDSSIKGSASGFRTELGINLHLIPFTYLTLAGGVANGEKLYHAGLGVHF